MLNFKSLRYVRLHHNVDTPVRHRSRRSGLLNAKFKFKGTFPTNRFRTYSSANKRPTTLSLTVFIQRNFLAEFLQSKCDFKPYAAAFAFWNRPLGRLGTTYDVHLGLIGKPVVNFSLVLIELFALGVTFEALRVKIDRKSAISLQRGHFDLYFQVEGDVDHQ